MRILMLNNEFPPLGGGTGVVNYHLLREMSAYEEVSVDLVTSSRSRADYEIESFAQRIKIFKVPVNNRNIHHSGNRELITYFCRGLRFSQELIGRSRYDLSFAFAGVPAGAISYALKQLARLPYLISLQGPDVPGFEARFNYLYPLLKPILRQIWKNAAAVTAISLDHQRLAARTMPGLQIPVIPNGVDTSVFRPSGEPQDKALINIICVARLIERKGQQYLLQAVASLLKKVQIPLRLTLVGTGDSEKSLRSMVTKLGLGSTVVFAGALPAHKMPDIYRQADIFVLPSQNEGMSIALLEAMASGLPVVVTNVGGSSELLQNEVNGFVIPCGDVVHLTRVLTKLINNPLMRIQMGQKSRLVAKRFTWKIVALRYLELCDRIVSNPLSRCLTLTSGVG